MSTLTGPEEAGGTHISHAGQVRPTKLQEKAQIKPSRGLEKQNEFIKTTKRPENSGTLSDTSLRSSRADFSLHREETNRKQTELLLGIQKVRAPLTSCHVTADLSPNTTNTVTHHPQPAGEGRSFCSSPCPRFSPTCLASMFPMKKKTCRRKTWRFCQEAQRRPVAGGRARIAAVGRPESAEARFTGPCV